MISDLMNGSRKERVDHNNNIKRDYKKHQYQVKRTGQRKTRKKD